MKATRLLPDTTRRDLIVQKNTSIPINIILDSLKICIPTTNLIRILDTLMSLLRKLFTWFLLTGGVTCLLVIIANFRLNRKICLLMITPLILTTTIHPHHILP